MSPHRNKRYILIFSLIIVALIASACGGSEDPTPTPRSVQPTVTPVTTSISGIPSPTTISFGPTSTPFQGFPTLSGGVAPTLPPRLPNNIQINSPAANGTIRNNVTIFGSASHPDFVQYTLEYGPQNNPGNLWYPITQQAVTVAVLNGALGAWNTSLVQDGTYQLRLHVYLTGGREITNVVVSNLSVQNSAPTNTPPPTNTAPTISPVAPFKMLTNSTATIALGIFDPDGDTTTFAAASGNNAVATVSPVGQAITVVAKSVGVTTISLTVTDARGATASTSFVVTVEKPADPNNAPTIAAIPNQTLQQGTVIGLQLTIVDPDGDEVTFTASSAAPSIVSVTKGANQVINLSGLAQGTTTVTVTATDSKNASRSAIFSVVVNPPSPTNNPPSIGTIGSQTIEIGEQKILSLSVSDADGDSLQVTATSTNNGVVSIVGGNETSLTISGNAAGSASVTVLVSDGKGGSASTSFGVTVNNPPAPNNDPTIGLIGNQALEVGQTVNIDLVMSDPDGDPISFAPNSSDAALVTVGTVDSDTINVTGVAEGSADVTVIVTDNNGGSTSTTFTVAVSPAAVPNNNPTISQIVDQNLETGQNVDLPITIGDPDGDTVTVNASSDNAGVTTVFYIDATSSLNVGAVAPGSATITVNADDGKGGTATMNFTVNVADPVVINNPPSIAPIGNQTIETGANVDIPISFSDPDAGDTLDVTTPTEGLGHVTASFINPSTVRISGTSAGAEMVTVTVTDALGETASTNFTVTVNDPSPTNNPPTIDPIGAQVVDEGATINIPINYSDPDVGDTLTVVANSDGLGFATAVYVAPSTVQVTGVAAGAENVTVTVADALGEMASTSFAVTVNAPAPVNNPPTIAPIGAQVVDAGATINVPISYSDPDAGDTLTVVANSDGLGFATAVYVAPSTVQVTGVAAGAENVTVTVTDALGAGASTSFAVTVNAPAPVNNPPTIAPIGAQVVDAGATINVPISYSDPDAGDTLTVVANSDGLGFATAVYVAPSTVQVTGVTAGAENVTVTVTDALGESASTTFGVTVNAPAPVNNPPTIDPVSPQSVDAGGTIDVAIVYGDIDAGDTVNVSVGTDGAGFVSATYVAPSTVQVTGVSAGTENVTVTVTDSQLATASTSFAVTVADVKPPFDVTGYPEIPTIDFGSLNPIYQTGLGNGNRNTVFSVAGDDGVNSANYLDAFADGAVYNLGSYASLQGVIDHHSAIAHDTTADLALSWNVQSAATGDGWTIDTLFNPTFAGADCNAGETPLACELRLTRPSVLIVSFTPTNATASPLGDFQSNLQLVVSTATANGTIPVLATLPNDGSVDAGTLAQYNEVIVNVATASNVPLWNLYNTMTPAVSGVYAVGGANAGDLTDPALTSGYNRRNLATLQILNAIKGTLYP